MPRFWRPLDRKLSSWCNLDRKLPSWCVPGRKLPSWCAPGRNHPPSKWHLPALHDVAYLTNESAPGARKLQGGTKKQPNRLPARVRCICHTTSVGIHSLCYIEPARLSHQGMCFHLQAILASGTFFQSSRKLHYPSSSLPHSPTPFIRSKKKENDNNSFWKSRRPPYRHEPHCDRNIADAGIKSLKARQGSSRRTQTSRLYVNSSQTTYHRPPPIIH